MQPPEPLAQRVQAGGFGDQGLEAEVGANLQALGRDQHDRSRRSLWQRRFEKWFPASDQIVTLQRSDAPGKQDDVCRLTDCSSQHVSGGTSSGHPVEERDDSLLALLQEISGSPCDLLDQQLIRVASLRLDSYQLRDLACFETLAENRVVQRCGAIRPGEDRGW